MLGKLLKYELKATARIFLPIYLGLLVICFIGSFTFSASLGLLNAIVGILIGGSYIALFVSTIVLLVQRFYKNFLSDEGYLMFTLPVRTSSLIGSKLIVTFIWFVSSAIIGTISGFLLARDEFTFSHIKMAISELLSLPSELKFTLWLFVLVILIGTIFTILQVYLSLSIGQLPPFGKHRILFAFLAFIALTILLQIIGMLSMELFTNLLVDDTLMHLASNQYYENTISNLVSTGEIKTINNLLIVSIIETVIFCIAAFYATAYILKRKLNLE